jgi:hypothetical protein
MDPLSHTPEAYAGESSRSSSLPPEILLVVTDSLECSATFVLTRLLVRTLRDDRQRPAVLVGCSQPLSRFSGICRKAVRASRRL